MYKLDKILLLFFLLIGFGFSVCMLSLFYPLPLVQNAVMDAQAVFPWLSYAFAGYNAIMCLCFSVFLLITLFFPNKSNFLIIAKSKGKLEFSKKTVESTIRYSFADLKEINSSKIKIKLHRVPNKTKVYVKLALNDTKELAPLTETVQEKIASALQASLDITVKSIAIRVTEFNSGNTAKNESSEYKEDKTEDSRII